MRSQSCQSWRAAPRPRPARVRLAWVCLLWCVSCAADYPALVEVKAVSSSNTCLVHARVLAGETLQPEADATLCFSTQQITYLGRDAPPSMIQAATVVDVQGATVLPGLIDTHVHVTATDAPPWRFRRPDPEHNLEAWLWSGITTVFDLGGDPAALSKLAGATARGEIPGPQIFFGHEPITAVEGHPIPAIKSLLPWPLGSLLARQVPTLAAPSEADALVARMHQRGAQYIKLIHDSLPPGAPRLDRERLAALVDAAHRRQLKVMVHIGSNQDAFDAVYAGADHLAHGVYNQPIDDELVRLLSERHVTVTYTAAGFDNTRQMATGHYQPAAWVRDTTDPTLVEAVTGASGKQFGEAAVLGDFAHTIVARDVLLKNIAKLHAASVVVLPGTDSPIAAVFPGASYLEELALLHEAGISILTVLQRATVRAAQLIEIPGAQRFGVLEVGARADVLVLGRDPTTDLGALRDVVHVFSAGRPVTRLR
jgi:imidazolonepropionase-like amidohydrolase